MTSCGNRTLLQIATMVVATATATGGLLLLLRLNRHALGAEWLLLVGRGIQ